MHPLHRFGVFHQELIHQLRALLHQLPPGHGHAGNHGGAVVQGVPLFRQVQGHPEVFQLPLGHGDKGLGQQGDVRRSRRQGGDALGMFRFPVDGHVPVRVQAVLLQEIPEAELRGRPLPGGGDGFALEVRHGLNALPAVFHNVEHAQGIDGQGDDLALGLVVENRRQVGGDTDDIQVPLDEGGGQLISGAR